MNSSVTLEFSNGNALSAERGQAGGHVPEGGRFCLFILSKTVFGGS